MTESEEEVKNLLMTVKEENENAGLKLNVQKMKIMAYSPITSWEIDGETVETMTDYFGGAPKSWQIVTAAMKLKRCLLFGRKDTSELWCWRRLKSPLDCKEIQPVHPQGNQP